LQKNAEVWKNTTLPLTHAAKNLAEQTKELTDWPLTKQQEKK